VNDTLVATGKLSSDKFRSYDLYTDAVADLIIGPSRVGAVVIDSPVAQAFSKNGNVKNCAQHDNQMNHTVFAVKKGNTDLVNKINTGLTASYDDNLLGGTY